MKSLPGAASSTSVSCQAWSFPERPLLCPHLRPPCTKWPNEAAVPLPLGGPSWSPQVSVEEGIEHPPHFLALPRALRARH